MKLTVKPSNEILHLQLDEVVRLPWNTSVIVAFEGRCARLKQVDPESVQLREYHLGVCGEYAAGLIKQLPAPGLIVLGAAQLLRSTAFKDLAPYFHHPTGWICPHPNMWQIPHGSLGGGAILIKDVTMMAFGRRAGIPSAAVEKKALMREHTLSLLKELGYVQTAAPAPGPEETA